MSGISPIDCELCQVKDECFWGKDRNELIRTGGRIPKKECVKRGGRFIPSKNNIFGGKEKW